MDYSKVKHVFRIYTNVDGMTHCEKYPVIYINSEYCYIKIGRKRELESVKTSQIREKYDIDNPNFGYYFDIDRFAVEDFQTAIKCKQLQHNLDYVKRGIESAKKDIARYEKWVCEYSEQLKALGNNSQK